MIAPVIQILTHQGSSLSQQYLRWEAYLREAGVTALSRHPAWLSVLQKGMGHVPYCIEARQGERTCGYLPLALVQSWLFGKFLVSLPYLTTAGIVADDAEIAQRLISTAARLADHLEVKYLELRHEHRVLHPSLPESVNEMAHVRLALPKNPREVWDGLRAKVRNQISKSRKNKLTVRWGGLDLLSDFYGVLCRHARDLGTPVYPRRFFEVALMQFPNHAEICVVGHERQAIAAGFVLHGDGVSEIPSAGSLPAHNLTDANALLYWSVLERAIARGQFLFDFGRWAIDGPTFRFNKQWGGESEPAEWQYYCRRGSITDVRRDNPKYVRMIRLWRKLPVRVANVLGPMVVRGIP